MLINSKVYLLDFYMLSSSSKAGNLFLAQMTLSTTEDPD